MVMWPARSESRNTTASAMSSGVASLPSGMPALKISGSPAITRAAPLSSAHMPVCIGVRVEPGATTLQRTP